jgi:hypothetical protein
MDREEAAARTAHEKRIVWRGKVKPFPIVDIISNVTSEPLILVLGVRIM